MAFRIGKGLAAALVLLFTLPAQAQVPDPFARGLARQLAHAETVLGQHGLSHVAGPFPGELAQGATQRFQVTLRAGQEYEIVGVCDFRCREVGVTLADAPDRGVGARSMTDDIQVLQVRPRVTGPHMIDVTMGECGGGPCYFAFNVYAQQVGR